jgi:hypothetical protein
MYDTKASLTLDLNTEAVKVLKVICDDSNLFRNTWVTTRAWYDGPERGVCLEVGKNHVRLFITFGERRGSDELFVDNPVAHVRML